jgi:hypothetical protein
MPCAARVVLTTPSELKSPLPGAAGGEVENSTTSLLAEVWASVLNWLAQSLNSLKRGGRVPGCRAASADLQLVEVGLPNDGGRQGRRL